MEPYIDLAKENYESLLSKQFSSLDEQSFNTMVHYPDWNDFYNEVLIPLFHKHKIVSHQYFFSNETIFIHQPALYKNDYSFYDEYFVFDEEREGEYAVEQLRNLGAYSEITDEFYIFFYNVATTKSEDCILDFINSLSKVIDEYIHQYMLNVPPETIIEKYQEFKKEFPIINYIDNYEVEYVIRDSRDYLSDLPKITKEHIGNVGKAYYDMIIGFLEEYSNHSSLHPYDLKENYYDKMYRVLREEANVLLERDINNLELKFEIILKGHSDKIIDKIKSNEPFEFKFDSHKYSFKPNGNGRIRPEFALEIEEEPENLTLSSVVIVPAAGSINVHISKSEPEEIYKVKKAL